MKPAEPPTSTPAPTKRRTAVVAVHGVADQAEGDSARRIADLLRAADPGAYTTFEEHRLRIEVEEILRAESRPPKRRRRFEAREGIEFSDRASASDRSDEIGPRFAELALRGAVDEAGAARHPDRSIDATLRLSGARRRGDHESEVDVFELYWADLSRFRGTVARFLSQAFQLVVHLLSLGREALRTADEVAVPAHASWKLLVGSHKLAHRLFTLAVLPLNLLLLVLAPLALVSYLPAPIAELLFSFALAIVFLFLGVLAIRRSPTRGWLLASLASAMLGLGIAWLLTHAARGLPIQPLFVAVAIGLGAAYVAVGVIYARRRPFADRIFGVLGVVVFLTAAWSELRQAWVPGVHSPGAHRVFWLAEILLIALVIAWVLFALTSLVSAAAHGVFWLRAGRGWRAHRHAATTSRITLVMPAALLFFGGFTLWALLGPPLARLDSSPFAPRFLNSWVLPPIATAEAQPTRLVDWVQHLIALSGTSLMTAVVIVLSSLLVVLALPVLPGIASDLSDRVRDAWNPVSMGRGFDDGLRLARLAGEAFFVVFLGGTALGLVFSIPWAGSVPDWARPSGDVARWIGWLGGSAALSAATILALSDRISLVARRSSPVLDVLLDVDNHLRVTPPGSHGNSRARIVARAVALLGEIERGGYDSVILVSHSQGSALLLDLLRQLDLRRRLDPSDRAAAVIERLRSRELHLLTMGTPVRQLYALRFPHLYGWISQANATNLGVSSWLNFYRTGDFVGRAVWEQSATRGPEGGGRLEGDYCLGSGGHNRYWDSSAPEVARAIDQRIA